jgi:hypothetical protein
MTERTMTRTSQVLYSYMNLYSLVLLSKLGCYCQYEQYSYSYTSRRPACWTSRKERAVQEVVRTSTCSAVVA